MAYRECDICGGRHLTKLRKRPVSEREMKRRCLLGKYSPPGELERALKEAMRARDGSRCQRCGKTVSGHDEHLSHVIGRRQCGRLKYLLENVLTLCYQCHLWWHENVLDAADWFRNRWPDRDDYLASMRVAYSVLGTIPVEWYEMQLEELRAYALQSQD